MLAIEALSWMEMQKLNERLALARTMKQLRTRDADSMRLGHMLVYETVRRQNFIDAFINSVLETGSIDDLSLGVQAFLRLYVYQTRIAGKGIRFDLEEAKNIARLGRVILGWKTLQPIEPILGTLLTQNTKTVFEGRSDEERIGLLTYHPAWYVKYCFNLFGRREALTMLEADLQTPPTYVRLNTLKANESQILEKLAEEEVQTERVEQLKYTYRIVRTKTALTRLESYREGLFYIQDMASCFETEAADPQPGMTVFDICAAPGAKTTHLAQLMQNRGAIYSIDFSRRRMRTWKAEVAHMGVKIAEPIIADVCSLLPLTEKADVLILDPPCTSSGTFGKSPSAKWRLTRRSIHKMAEIQWQMLANLAEYVKPGGTLIYSSCSITVEENEMLIERFLKHNLDFTLAEITPKMGLPGLRGLSDCRRLHTNIHHCNGLFLAKLSKGET